MATKKEGETPPENKGKEAEEKPEEEVDDEEVEDVDDKEVEKDGKEASATEKAGKEYLAKLKEENKTRRLLAKAQKEKIAELEKKLSDKEGGKEKEDPVKAIQAKADEKMRNALLRGALAEKAGDAHNHRVLFDAIRPLLKDVEVDVENDYVDDDTMDEVVAKAKEQYPFMFKSVAKETDEEGKKVGKLPLDSGAAVKGKNHYSQWKTLQKQNRNDEAQEYYAKHRLEIFAQMKANPSLLD